MKKIPNNLIEIIDDGKKKTSKLLADCKALFPVWSYFSDEDLDRDFPPIKTKRYFKKVQEADEELKNKSAEQLEKEGIKGITLRERLIMELEYYRETGNHLDIENVTLCSGSRYQDGYVPYVSWYSVNGGLYVYWCSPQDACDYLRSREAVSLDSFNSVPSDKVIKELKKMSASWREQAEESREYIELYEKRANDIDSLIKEIEALNP